MGFTESVFLMAMAPAVALAWIMPRRWAPAYLLLASYGFYATWRPGYLVILVGVSALVYAMGLWIGRTESEDPRRRLLVASLVVLLAVLALFKYPEWLGALIPSGGFFESIIAPLGISYYLFKAISYLVDVHWDSLPPERDPVRVALYLAFFPQILSGPIQRAPDFMAQTRGPDFCRPDAALIEKALGLCILGFFEKLVLADRIAPLVAACDAPAGAPPLMALVADYGYTMQLFTDFSGLTHIALGLGLLFGVTGPANFNRPFAADNIQDFWRRWHMSLTSWLGDYVFLPLRMSLRGCGTLGLCLSLVLNMVLIGLWHGGSATYLAFGLIHGAFLVGSALTLARRDRLIKRHPWLNWPRRALGPILVFHMVVFAQIFFRAPDMGFAWHNIGAILGLTKVDPSVWSGFDKAVWRPALIAGLIGLELATGWLGLARRFGALTVPRRPIVAWCVYAVGALLTILMATETGGQFMYARF